MTVSYTHLDVYKRQEYGQRQRNCNLEDMDMDSLQRVSDALGIPTGAVSYTHLDVYKRQIKAVIKGDLYESVCLCHYRPQTNKILLWI